MALPSVQNGVSVTIGWPGGIGISSSLAGVLTTYLIPQSVDTSQEAERLLVHDSVGTRVGSIWMDFYKKVAMKFTVASATYGLANMMDVVNPLLASIKPGSFISILDCPAQPDLVGATYEVMSGPKLTGENKTYKSWTVDLEQSAGITGPAAP